ncbi:MAG: peptidoglycan-associated lipoprotein Pal [Candidatus Methylomirabilales bacterium]
MKRLVVLSAVLALGLALLTGCPKRAELGQGDAAGVTPTPTASAPATGSSTAAPRGGTETAVGRPAAPTESRLSSAGAAGGQAAGAAAGQQRGPLQDIFFDFDRDAIRDDQKAALDANAAWLKARPNAKVTIEGHADERGTSEYNLALGDRRAKTSRDYLVAKGVEASRITVVSYGEERPFVLGHDENAWRWNRRAHFVVSGQ